MGSKKLKKRKIFLFLVTLLFGTISIEAIGSNKAYAFSEAGTGTVSDPYIITSKEQLKEISSNLSANYKLGCDIDLGNVEWTPIGNSTSQFSGVFDGAGHIVKNLSITKGNADGNSLFGYANGGTIKNLRIKGVNINGQDFTGAIVGSMSGTSILDNCSAEGSVTGKGNTGGLVGQANGLTISNSYSSVNVTGKGDNVGGVIGNLTGNITNCYATAEVIGQSGNCTGSLVGKEEGNITKSYTTNAVSSNGSYVGGLAGWLRGKIDQCYASGGVTAAGDDVGGIVGYSNPDNVIQNSFNLGIVKGRNYVGGLQGYNAGTEASNATIKNSYSSGRIIVTGTGSGGLSGTNTTIISSYYDGVASKYAPQSVYDISKLSTNMKMTSTFKDWDLTGVWAIDEGSSYPYLRGVQKPDGVTAAPVGEVAGGIGTNDNPYIISTAKQLQNIKYDVGASYKLANDINIENIDWMAIGRNSAVPFTGIFDGNGHAIKNFSGDYTNGIFGCVKGATIKNLNIKGVNISDGSYTGALASNVYGGSIIDNCSVTDGTVTGSGCTGGLIGIGNNVTITNSYSNVNVVGRGDSVGGLVGSITGTIKDCYVLGNVNSKSSNVGGIVGSFQGDISEVYFSGIISGANNVGGLLGNSSSGTVKDCFSLGTISGNSYVGGILGNGNTTITNSYSAAKTSGSGTNVGGISGTSNSVKDSYFDSRISGIKTPEDQSKDTKDLYNKDTYSSWDFSSTWSKEAQYPYLTKLPKPNFPVEIPDGLKVSDVTSTSMKVAWNVVDGAVGYDIEVDGKVINTANSASYEFTGLAGGTSHTYRVRAKTSNMDSDWSSPISQSTLSVVNNVTATVTSTSLKITWDAVSGVTSYEVEVDGELTKGLTDTSYEIKDLAPGTVHNYRVRAITEAGIGDWSALSSKTTLNLVTGIKSSVTSTSIKLAWDAIEGVASYSVEVDGKVVTGITNTSYEITGLTPGTAHTYRIRAEFKDGAGDFSELTNATTLSVVTNVSSTVTSASINVSWDKLDGAISYDIEVDGKIISDIKGTSYEISGLTPGTSHTYRVRVISAGGIGDWSDLTTKSTLSVVTNVSGTATGNSITVNWAGVTGAISYDIEVDGRVISDITGTSYVISDLTVGTSHTYRIRVKTEAGVGEWTDLFNKVTLSVVTNVTSISTTNSITVNWDKVDGATGYDIEVDGKVITGVTGTSYVISDITAGTSHTYRVRAKVQEGLGDWSEIVTQSTLSVVENVTSTVTSSSMTVNWAGVTGAVSYDIEVDGKVITGVTGTSYVVTGLTEGTSHTYRVRVTTSVGIGEWTTLSTQTTINMVTSINSTVTSSSIGVSWAKVVGAATYDIEVDGKIITGISDTNYVISGLTAGTSHTYRVRAVLDSGVGDWSELLTKSTLSVVTNVTSVVTSASITVNWDVIKGATSYEIEVDGKVITGITGTSYVISDLSAGTSHTYKVRVVTAEGTSDWNELVTKSTLSVVTNVTAVVNSTSMTVNWTAVTGATSYEIEVDGKVVVGITGTSYVLSGLTPGTDHTYRVRVVTSAGVGEWTAITSKTTINVAGNVTSSVGSTSLTVSWTAAVGALSYDIEVDGKVITGVTGTSYVISGLEPGTNHTYRVRVVTSAGISDWSEIVTKTTINMATNITAVLKDNSMIVTWGATVGATSYDIEVDGKIITGITGTSYVVTGLIPGKTYTYKVRVNTSVGVGDWSEPISKTDLDVVITNGVKAVVTGTSVNLSWTEVKGATGYDVEVDGTIVSVGNVGTYVAINLQAGVTHTYRIRPTTSDGVGDWSDPIVKTTLDVIMKGSVTSVATDTSVNVSWTPISGAMRYDIEVNGTVISGISGTNYVITGLEPGATVTYRIRPTTVGGVGSWSEVVSQTTLSVVGGVVSISDSTSLSVSWGVVTGAISYDIEVDGKIITGVTGTGYVISGLAPGTDHTYRVRVTTSAGVGVWSDIVTKTTLSVVGGVVSTIDSKSISVSWGVVTGAISYDIEIDGTVISGVSGTSYVISSLQPNSSHAYRVRAITSAGVGVWSEISTKTTLSVVTNVTSIVDTSSMTIAWGAVTGAISYDIEIDGTVTTGITGVNYVVSGLTAGTSHNYRVRAITSSGTGTWSELGSCSILLPATINIQCDKTTISSGSTLVVYVMMKNCNNVSSEYINLQYDNKAFKFISAEATNTDKFQISDEENIGDGLLEFIGGSNGQENSISGESQILKLTFKVNQDVSQGSIAVLYAMVGDTNDKVYEATCLGQTFQIVTGDVNGDGKVGVDDMAIASKLVGTDSSKWGSYTPDVNGDGKVDNDDLKIIANHLKH